MRTFTLFLLLPFLSISQEGPGGVGNQTTNRFWQDATLINQSNGTTIANWINIGGNILTPIQNTASLQPILLTNNFNSVYSSIRFDGVNDILEIPDNNDIDNLSIIERSYFGVFRTSNDVLSRKLIYKEGGVTRGFNIYQYNGYLYCGAYNLSNDGAGSPWGFFSVNQLITPNTSYIFSFIYNGNDGVTGTINFYLNGSLVGAINSVGRLYPHEKLQFGGKSLNIVYESGSSVGITGDFFNGEIAEFIHYNYAVNIAQRMIVQNYLSAKYNISLTSDDLFNEDDPIAGNFDHQVAGIGRIDNSNINSDAKGTGIVRILNPQNLDDNEFLIWGHNNGVQQAVELIDVPLPIEARFNRVWRFSEVNTASSPVSVGLIDVRFDLNGLGSVTASDLRLLIDDDNDGVFNDETPIAGAINIGGGVFEFQNLPVGAGGTRNNKRFTLGTINSSITPLPIELVYFKATAQNNNSVKVEWQTEFEENNDFFTVERSQNGLDWEIVTTVDAAGNSNALLTYSIIDTAPFYGVSYYRLKQTDFNGYFKYSQLNTVNLSISNSNDLEIYPIPTSNLITLEGDNLELSEIKVFNSLGQDVSLNTTITFLNSAKVKVDLSKLPTGIYSIKTRSKYSLVQVTGID